MKFADNENMKKRLLKIFSVFKNRYMWMEITLH